MAEDTPVAAATALNVVALDAPKSLTKEPIVPAQGPFPAHETDGFVTDSSTTTGDEVSGLEVLGETDGHVAN